jgi:hypothetical protein
MRNCLNGLQVTKNADSSYLLSPLDVTLRGHRILVPANLLFLLLRTTKSCKVPHRQLNIVDNMNEGQIVLRKYLLDFLVRISRQVGLRFSNFAIPSFMK